MIHMIRHGQSVANADPSIYLKTPNWDIELSELGREQAKEAANSLADTLDLSKTVYVYYSPFQRTIQTTDYILDELNTRGFNFFDKEDPLLSEREWGTEWRKLIDQRGFFPEDFRFYAKPGGAESYAELYTRVRLFRNYLSQRYDDSHQIVLITHGEWIQIALMVHNNLSVGMFEKIQRDQKIKNGSIHTIN
jgi:broad specificity phosphatase PhoE